MGVTNQYERDFNDTSFLKRPGRIDLIVFQNVPDVGDGSPGLQRAFRNYLHTGGMEYDLHMNSKNIDELVDINLSGEIVFPSATIHSSGTDIHIHPNTGNADGNLILHPVGSNIASVFFLRNSVTSNYGDFQIKLNDTTASLESGSGGAGSAPTTLNINDADWDNINIGDASANITLNAVSISATQFGYVGNMDQGVHQSQSPQFAGLTLTGNLALVANSITGTSVNINNAELQQLSNIGAATISGAQWGYVGNLDQDLITTSDVTFDKLTLTDHIVESEITAPTETANKGKIFVSAIDGMPYFVREDGQMFLLATQDSYGFYCAGANPTANNTIDYINIIKKAGDAIDRGNSSVATLEPNGVRGITNGFYAAMSLVDYIDVTVLTGNAVDVGDMAVTRYSAAGVSGRVYGFFAGGYFSSTEYNEIEYIDMTTESPGNTVDRGDLNFSPVGPSGVTGEVYGFVAGGWDGNTTWFNYIDYFDKSTTSGNATDKGDLTKAKEELGGVSGPNYGFFGGGYDGVDELNEIDYINTTTTTGNASDKGDLVTYRRAVTGISGYLYGFICGGYNGGTQDDEIEYIDMTTTSGNASDRGDLTVARNGGAGV